MRGRTDREGHTWEVSRARGLHARTPVLREAKPDATMAEAIASVLNSGHAALVTRSDWTVEARRARWESEFYDIDRAGRRRRRYRRSATEREWEDFYRSARKVQRDDRKLVKDGVIECRLCGARWSTRAPANFHECKGEMNG